MAPRAAYEFLLDVVSAEEKRGIAPGTIRQEVECLRSFWSFHDIEVTKKVRISNPHSKPTISGEVVYTQDELGRLLRACTVYSRVAVSLMAFSGMRPAAISRGSDGVRLRDVIDLQVKGGAVSFNHVPSLILVRAEISKNKRPYRTFLGKEGCDAIRENLEFRLAHGEKLGPDSSLMGNGRFWDAPRFPVALGVSQQIRRAAKKAGFQFRPYLLRAYFDTRLLECERKGFVTRDYRQHWMGHVGDIEAQYTTAKNTLPESLIEDMRSSYAKCEPYLSTVPTKTDAEGVSKIFRAMLLGLGYAEKELDGLDLTDPQVFQDLMQKKMVPTASRPKQKMVSAAELTRYLDDGWTVVTALPGDHVVLNPPGL